MTSIWSDRFLNLQVVHASGTELEQYYREADVFAMVRESHPYLDFCMPVKLFEAIGHGLPIISSPQEAIKEFIEREKVGWVVADADELADLLTALRDDPVLLSARRQQVLQAQKEQTWQKRAEFVAQNLTQATSKPTPAIVSHSPC